MSFARDDALISVVIPAFNAERFLADAIDSVRNQSYAHTEIIVVDDGSTDRTFQIASQIPGVRAFQQPNGGIGAARNTGIQHGKGELLAFLDSDDLWVPDKLERQISAAKDFSQVDMITGGVSQFYDPSHPSTNAPLPDFNDAAVAGTLLIPLATFHRVGGFNPKLAVGEFIDWHSRAMAAGLRATQLDHILLKRRIHDSNTGIRLRDTRQDYLKVLKSHLDRKRSSASGSEPTDS